LGALIVFNSGKSPYHFIAKSRCCCYKIPKETFWRYIQENPKFLLELLHLALLGYEEIVSSFQARQEGKVANRLCDLLLKNSKCTGEKRIVNKRLNNAEISRLLGIHQVTVARILKTLRNEGIIYKENNVIVILDEIQLDNYIKTDKNLNY
jgi:CRP-like cAMP-binding protein